MKSLLLSIVMSCSVLSCGYAQDAIYEVRGLAGTPKAEKEGFSVSLLDSGSDVLLVAGAAIVKDTIGTIESAQLLITDKAGKRVSRAVLLPQRVGDYPSSTLEFDLRSDLLEKSIIVIRVRKGDEVIIAKIVLGSFHVASLKK